MTSTQLAKTDQLRDGSQMPPLHAVPDFYDKASALLSEFEEKLALSVEANVGLTPFSYAFSQSRWQLLTAGAEQIFTQAILDDVIDRICAWATDSLGALHVSTPQVRVFINGCKRDLVRDNINARWHYLLFLSRDWPRSSWLKVMTGTGQHAQRFETTALLKSRPAFNQLIVHDIEYAYGIDFSGRAMNPARGIVFLDGYLW